MYAQKYVPDVSVGEYLFENLASAAIRFGNSKAKLVLSTAILPYGLKADVLTGKLIGKEVAILENILDVESGADKITKLSNLFIKEMCLDYSFPSCDDHPLFILTINCEFNG